MRSKKAILLALLTVLAAAALAIGLRYAIIWSFLEPVGPIPAKANPNVPDIILISIDSVRPDHLGCYGYGRATSPTIDLLASQGVRCENAISTTSWTLPAHAALFTGLYDSAHGLVDNGQRLAEAHVTLAEILGQAGYQTAGFFGGPYLHPVFGVAQGFGTYESCMTKLPDNADERLVRLESRNPVSASHADITGPRTLKKVKTWLAQADERPMFVFLHFWDPHYDYIPPKKYIEMFDPDYQGQVNVENFMSNRAINPYMAQRDLQHVVALYDGEIRFTDDILGEILTELDRAGRGQQALIVLTADHGEEFFEHGGKGHQRTLFDEVVRIPLIFRWTGDLPQGATVTDQVRLIDVMPTILALAGVRLDTKVQGRDISRLLRGDIQPAQSAICELLVNQGQTRALRTNRMKVVKDWRSSKWAYFDLEQDPREQRAIASSTGPAKALLEELEKTTRESLSLYVRRTHGKSQEVQISEEMLQRLRSLGYIDDGKEQ